MSTGITAAIITASAAGVVAILVFIVGRVLEWRGALRRQKSEAVLRMLGVIEAFIMQRSRPTLVGLWSDGPNSLVLAQFRFLADLGKKDEAVAVWVWGQIQPIVFSNKPARQVALASAVSGGLVGWLRGVRTTQWFRDQNHLHPVDLQVKAPRGWQARRNLKSGIQIGAGSLIAIWFGWLISGRPSPFEVAR